MILDQNGTTNKIERPKIRTFVVSALSTLLCYWMIKNQAIKWADSSPLRYRRGSEADLGGPVADLWRIRQVDSFRGLKWIRCGLRRSPPRTQKSAADPLRIRLKYAAERRTFWSWKKVGVRHFWRTSVRRGVVSARPRIRRGFALKVRRGSAAVLITIVRGGLFKRTGVRHEFTGASPLRIRFRGPGTV